MLAILCESNILETLNARGIYPDEFFTDLRAFRDRCITYTDATVVIISIGMTRFSRQRLLEVAKVLQSQIDSGSPAIREFYLLADTRFKLKKYYMYDSGFKNFTLCNNFKDLKSQVDVISQLRKVSSEYSSPSLVRLHHLDEQNFEEELDAIARVDDLEAGYFELIQRPNIKESIVAQ